MYDVNVSNIYLYLTEDLDVSQEKMTAKARVVSLQENTIEILQKFIIILQTQINTHTTILQ